MNQFEKFTEDIPEEVRVALSSLDNQIRQAILVLLHNNEELSFTEIQDKLQIDKLKLNFHLKNLFSSALIDHYYRHEIGDQRYSYYAISRLGNRILDNLIKAFIPPSPIIGETIQIEPYTEFTMENYRRYLVGETFCTPKEDKKVEGVSDPFGRIIKDFQHRTSSITEQYAKSRQR